MKIDDLTRIKEMYSQLKSDRENYKPTWEKIARYTGIAVDPDYIRNKERDKGTDLDQYISDPTSMTAVNQFGDYIIGIMWGTGDRALNIVPSRYVLEYTDSDIVADYYDFVTSQLLYHMNHEDAGLNNSLKPYAYDQASFGTSAVGAFPNQAFKERKADNALIFRPYGIDNLCIDEGKNGSVEYIFATYNWRVSRIVGEFCHDGSGGVDESKICKLPKELMDCYQKGDLNKKHTIVFGVLPRADFDPKLQGKRGTKYRGVWFLENSKEGGIFAEEDFAEKPIAVARMIKVRGETFGRSSGTMLLSTISAVNFMLSTSIEILEKMANPSLGVFGNAIFGDSVLDTSPQGLTVFNPALSGNGNPAFPLFDVGNPAPLMQMLIPYLNDKILSAFKIDALLDFNQSADMTATESMQRYTIRAKSLAGILTQQKTELLAPLVKRCVSVLMALEQLGVDPRVSGEKAAMLLQINKQERIIPDEVSRVMAEGRPWFEIRFNNEMERMTRTEALQNLIQVLNAIGGIAPLYPQIIEAVDWYKLLADINNNLDANNQIIISEQEFKDKILAAAQMQQNMMAMQAGQMGAQIQKDMAGANKSNSEAANGIR
jgi:hypothetical protein